MSKVFYYINTSLASRSYGNLINPIFEELPEGARFHSNMARAFVYESFILRQGEWSSPWKTAVMPGNEMPVYDPDFKKTFAEVTDDRAKDVADIIERTGRKIAVFYSGGIDSTTCVAALIKNLTHEQLENVYVCLSADSIIENPNFYSNFIKDKIKTLDSLNYMYSDLADAGYVSVTADIGDALFGTELGTKMYAQYMSLIQDMPSDDKRKYEQLYFKISDSQTHYSNFRQLIINYLNKILQNSTSNINEFDKKFGEQFYEKLNKNIQTSKVPIVSLHDFYWWIIFNVKYLHCALRAGLIYSKGSNRKNVFGNNLFNWYGNSEYQLWSMANNNNGQKIIGTTQGSYKHAARKYIYDLDHNEWYFNYKIKIASMPFIVARNYRKHFKDFDPVFGLDTNYDVAMIGTPDVDALILDGLKNYKIDW